MSNYDGWTVVLHEMMLHIQKFVDDNPMEYKGKELKAYTTALGMVSILAKNMIEDIQREKADVEV
jgi:hypothetical protein|tara:strand:+ start:1131 stop:1325 length:195 start_codon:yes stop_codon:yes gene_type:complete